MKPFHEYEIIGVLGICESYATYVARHIHSKVLVALKAIRSNAISLNNPLEKEKQTIPQTKINWDIKTKDKIDPFFQRLSNSDIARTRLFREAHAMASCQHPGIIKVYEVGEFNEVHYFTMELAPGGNLNQRLNVPWGSWQAARLVAVIAQAVGHVHKLGLIHCAICPRHIFFGKDEEIKLGGFSSHKMIEGAENTGIDKDICDLGILLHQLLTAKKRAAKKSKAFLPLDLRKNFKVEYPLPSEVIETSSSGALAHELDAIYLRCLSMDPDQKYKSALALANDLQSFCKKHQPTLARRFFEKLRNVAGYFQRPHATDHARHHGT